MKRDRERSRGRHHEADDTWPFVAALEPRDNVDHPACGIAELPRGYMGHHINHD